MKDSGISAYSDVRVVDTDPPAAPENVLAVGESLYNTVSWSRAKEAIVTGYELYRSERSDGEYMLLKEIKGRDITSYADKTVTVGTIYYYKLLAVDEYGRKSGLSQAASASALADSEPPYVVSIHPESTVSVDTYLTGTVSIKVKAQDNAAVERITLQYSLDDGENWIDYETKATGSEAVFEFDTRIADSFMIRAIAYDVNGNTGDGSPTRKYYADNTAPQKVTGLAVHTVSSSVVTLKWEDVADGDFSYFEVEENDGSGYKKVGTVRSELGINLSGRIPKKEYTYRVCAYDIHGNKGEYSDELTVTMAEDTEAPIIKSISPRAYRTNSDINLSISAYDNNRIERIEVEVSSDLEAWNKAGEIDCGSGSSEVTKKLKLDISPYSDGQLYVRATAYDSAGNASDTKNNSYYVGYYIDKTAPVAPSAVNADVSDGYVNLSWNKNTESDIASYTVFKKEGNGKYYKVSSGLKTINYIDKAIEAGGSYSYMVAAVDLAGNESERSTEVSVTAPADTQAPVVYPISPSDGSTIGVAQPVNVTASDNNKLSKIVLEYYNGSDWTAVYEKKTNESSAVLKYALGKQMIINGVIQLRAYAKDTSGNNSEYVSAQYIVDSTAPALSEQKAEANGNDITVTWTSGKEADLAGYKIYTSKDGRSYTYIGSKTNNNSSEYSFVHRNTEGGSSYIYRIDVYDIYGNAAQYYTESVISTAEAVIPENVITPVMEIPSFMSTGEEEYFNASESSATAGVKGYRWDFGDGTTSDRVRPAHAYANEGTYNVTLTVYDGTGAEKSVSKAVTVKFKQQLGTLKVKVIDDSGQLLTGATVMLGFETDNAVSARTNSNGIAEFKSVPGEFVVASYKNEYLPEQTTVNIHSNAVTETTLRLVKDKIVTGKMTATRLTLSQIEALGIDISQPENHNIYECEIVIDFGTSVVNDKVIVNPSKSEPIKISVPDDEDNTYYVSVIPSSPNGGSGGGSGGSGESLGEEIYPEEEALLVGVVRIPTAVSWLKEMFAIDLYVMNHSSSDFKLTDCSAKLNIPDGLRILNTNNSSGTLVENMGTIKGGETGHAVWYVAGDKEGRHNVSADFTSTLDGFNQKVNARFEVEGGIEVYGSKYMKVLVEAEDRLTYGDDYTIRVGLMNEGPVSAYLPNVEISSDLFQLNNVYKTYGRNNPTNTSMDVLGQNEVLWKEYTISYEEVSKSILPTVDKKEYEGGVLFTNDSITKYIESLLVNGNGIQTESKFVKARDINEYDMEVSCEVISNNEEAEAVNINKLETKPGDDFPYRFNVTATRNVVINGEYQSVPAANTPVYYSMPYLNGETREGYVMTNDQGIASIIPEGVPEKFIKTQTSVKIRCNRTDAVTYNVKVAGNVKHGDIYGTVTDNDGNPVEGAVVKLSGFLGGSAVTNEEGEYVFEKKNAGSYILTFEKDGFHSAKRDVTISKSRNKMDAVIYKEAGRADIVSVTSLFHSESDTGTKYIPAAVVEKVTFKLDTVSSEEDPIEKYMIKVLDSAGNEIAGKAVTGSDGKIDFPMSNLGIKEQLCAEVVTKSGKSARKIIKLEKIDLTSSCFAAINPSIIKQNKEFNLYGKQAKSSTIKFKMNDLVKQLEDSAKDVKKVYDSVFKALKSNRSSLPDKVIKQGIVNIYQGTRISVKRNNEDEDDIELTMEYDYSGSWSVTLGEKMKQSSSKTKTIKHSDAYKTKTGLYMAAAKFETQSEKKKGADLGVSIQFKRTYKPSESEVNDDWLTTYHAEIDGDVSYNDTWTVITGSVINGYISAGITLGADAAVSKTVSGDIQGDPDELNADLNVYFNVKGSGGASLIHKKILSAGAYIKADNKVYFLPRWKLNAKISIGAEATVLFLEGSTKEYPIIQNTFDLSGSDARLADMAELAEISNIDPESLTYSPQERVKTEWLDSSVKLMSADTDTAGGETIARNIFSGSQNSLGKLNGSPVLFFVGDNTARTSSNRAQLMMSDYEYGAFAQPKAICDDGTGDYQPAFSSDGNTSSVVWVNTSEVLPDMDESTLQEMQDTLFGKLEICAAEYDQATGEFKNQTVISDTGYFNHTPCVSVYNGNTYAAWIANESNVLTNSAGSGDKIMYAACENGVWSAPTEIYSAGSTISSVSINANENGVSVAFGEVTDSDAAGNKIHTMRLSDGIWTQPEKLMRNSLTDGGHQFVSCADGVYIFFANGNAVYRCNIYGGTPEKIIDESGEYINEFSVDVEGDRISVLYKTERGENDGSGVYLSVYDGNAWSVPVKTAVCGEDSLSRNISGIINGNEVMCVYNSDIYTESADGSLYYRERTDLNKSVIGMGSMLEVRNAGIVSGAAIPGMDADIDAIIANIGTDCSDSITATLYMDEISAAAIEGTYETGRGLNGNEECKASFKWTVPEDYQKHKLYIEVTDGNTTDVYEYVPPMSNLEITGSESQDDGSIGIKISNSGYNDVDNVSVSLYDNENKLISTKNAGAMLRDEEETVMFDINSLGISDTALIKAVVSSDSGEFYLDDNTYEVTVSPQSNYILGDVNEDGKIDPKDAMAIVMYVAGTRELSNNQLLAADVVADGEVNPKDAVAILQLCAGLITSF